MAHPPGRIYCDTMSLITAEELVRRAGEPHLAIVDCRWYLGQPGAGLAAYAGGHIPGSVHADLDSDLSGSSGGGRHPLPPPNEFDCTLGRLGITADATVVVYDDLGGAIAARLWWMLTDQGHDATFVLDGGLDAWKGAGGETTTEVPSPSQGTAGIALRPWKGIATIDEVSERHQDTILVDARAADRYRGVSEPVDPRAGHIPGAINVPLTENLDSGRFRSIGDLVNRFAEAGVEADTDVVVHCGSGVTACHVILAAEVAGFPRPNLYVGSWSEWSASERPISTGERP